MTYKLSDVCDVRDGTHDSPKYVEQGYPLVTSKNIKDGQLDLSVVNFITEEDYNKINERSNVDDGDIIMPMIGTIGNPYLVEGNCDFAIKNVALIKCDNSKVINRFVWYFLQSSAFARYVESKNKGGTQKFLSLGDIRNIELPDVSTDEQKNIIKVLSRVDSIITKRKQQLQKLDELVKARFDEMFGDVSGEAKPLIELIQNGAGLSYGIIVPGDYFEGGKPMIRPSDFSKGQIDLRNVYLVDPEIEEKYSRTRLVGDELLIQVIGQPGQVMLATKQCKGMNVTRNLAVIRPDERFINRFYLKEFLAQEMVQSFLVRDTNQSTLKQLPLGKLKGLEIKVPSLILQNQFADFVRQIDKSKLSVQKSLDKLKTLKKVLMQKYFG